MTTMNYKGRHQKYQTGTSNYDVYGDVVERNGVSYVCNVDRTYGYIPEEPNSGFVVIGDGVGFTGAEQIPEINGGTYA